VIRAIAIVAIVCRAASARADVPRIAAVAIDPDRVDAAVLIGPAGQVYGPAPDHAGWIRTIEGGVATGVAAAAGHGDDI
jgi:hypothetical protein